MGCNLHLTMSGQFEATHQILYTRSKNWPGPFQKLLQFTKRQPPPNFGLMRLNNPRPVDPATGPDWQGKTDLLIRALRGGGLDHLLQEGTFRATRFGVH